jgi:hypothetical protein
VRSAHPPERLEVELPSLVGPSLAQRGYRLVGQGVSAVTWRRELSGRVLAGLVALGLLALGGLTSGDAGSVALGVACGVGAAVLLYLRRPATVTVALARMPDGTEVSVTGGRDAVRAEVLVRTAVGAPPPARPEDPRTAPPLWGPPR